jgi:hypothetical protein
MAGKNEALFKPFLFADQGLDALVADIAPRGGALAEAVAYLRAGDPGEAAVVLGSALVSSPGEATPWHRLVLAAAQARRGHAPAAIRTLLTLLEGARDSRLRLWAWNALRALGHAPDEAGGRQVEGVVLEVEGGHGVETLAAYADGTLRYLLPTGARVIWDAPDDRLAGGIAATVAGAAAVHDATAPGRLPGEPAAGVARMTLLTCAGLRAAEETLGRALEPDGPLAPLFVPATRLVEKVCAIAGW